MTLVQPITDFPDRLSPMVVKELRQGLRTRLFGGVMMVLHAILVLVTLMRGANSDGSEVRGIMDGLITFVLFCIFPLCGFSALAGEIKANTMDMLVLTRLSAGRIVLGKWAAIVLQSLLVTVSLMPYIVARYVYGGSELFADLWSLVFKWVISAALTAGVVALSTQKQFWLRALIIAVPLFFSGLSSMVWAGLGFMSGRSGGSSMGGSSLWEPVIQVLGCGWLIFALLSFAATRIAPPASLLSVAKRLVNLAALIVLPCLYWLTGQTGGALFFVTVVLIVASVDAMTEEVHALPSVYLPFYQRSWWGKIASWFLVPGWVHGFLYSLLLVLSCVVVTGLTDDWGSAARIWLVGCSLWFIALTSQFLSFRRTGDYLGAFCAGAFILYVLTMLSSLILSFSTRKAELQWMAGLLPTTTFSLMDGSVGGSLQGGMAVSLVWPLFLWCFASFAYRRSRGAREEARRALSA
ncbi:hypothetical protein [Prosthecobacter fusiformis]|nr:hypothetical protein [Prosthecobacter fusiformis]